MGHKPQLWHRLVDSASNLDAVELRNDAAESNAESCSMLARGSQAVVRGRIRSVSHNPRNGLPTVEAELWDGSGTVELVWLGRRRIVGIEPGRSIVVRGRVSEREGHRAIYNPRYELLQSA